MNSISEMVQREIDRDNGRCKDLGDVKFLWQPMLRSTGREFARPYLLTEAEAEARAARLAGLVWFNLITGDVVYSRRVPYHDAPLGGL